MQKFEYEGETYIYNNGKFYDESYQELCLNISDKVSKYFLSNKVCEQMNKDELKQHIKVLKECGKYDKSINAINIGLLKFDDLEFIKFCLPILTSNYRALGQPLKAIEIATEWLNKCNCSSSAVYVSIGCAYCDILDYDKAAKCAKRALAKQGGCQPSQPLQGLFNRIRDEFGDIV